MLNKNLCMKCRKEHLNKFWGTWKPASEEFWNQDKMVFCCAIHRAIRIDFLPKECYYILEQTIDATE